MEECLESIVVQKGFYKHDLELIVSDNSEDDETEKFMKEYEKKHNYFIIRYNKNKENLGMVRNWNKLLEMCEWNYFVFLSDDDLFYDEHSLLHLYEAITEKKADCVTGRKHYINDHGEEIDYKDNNEFYLKAWKKSHTLSLFDQLFWWNSMGFGGTLFKNYGYKFGYEFKEFADYAFNIQYLDKKTILIDTFVFTYRYHSSQLISKVKVMKSIGLYCEVLKISNVSWFHKILFFLKYSLGLIVLRVTWKLGGNIIHFLKKFFIAK